MMTVAGPAQFGSGRGVPVPSITTRVDPFPCVVSRDCCFADMTSLHWMSLDPAVTRDLVEAHVGRRDDLRPSVTVGPEQSLNVRTNHSNRCRIHGAQSLDNVGMLERCLHFT